jgi:type II restriction enzyme
VDAVVQPKGVELPHVPLLIEAKSAGDFTNVNKRRKEEAIKITQLKATYGEQVAFVLFLCGYFDAAYLGYEAAEGIDWIWEHRIEDIDQLGI